MASSEGRLARVEAIVAIVQADVSETKADVKALLAEAAERRGASHLVIRIVPFVALIISVAALLGAGGGS